MLKCKKRLCFRDYFKLFYSFSLSFMFAKSFSVLSERLAGFLSYAFGKCMGSGEALFMTERHVQV